MHATFRWYADPSFADVLAEHADSVREVIGGVAGLRGYYVVKTDQGTVSVTVCDDEAGAARSSELAAAWIRENLPDLEIAAPNISSGEVAVSI